MNILFSKYHGAGNDFILINDTENAFPKNNNAMIRKMCDRRFGIGADGLILLKKSKQYDFKMIYFNSDGNEGTMCGNGGRCIVAFSKDCGYIKNKRVLKFEAVDGVHDTEILSNGEVSLGMKDVTGVEKKAGGFCVDTGSVHHVEYVDKLVDIDVCRRGRAIRESAEYAPGGCNVNFIKQNNKGDIHIRTYERGVENETLACGTGAVASAIVSHFNGDVKTTYIIKARGGILKVSFEAGKNIYKNIWLKGPATFVFEGVWKI